jgi:hypothetical protein
MDHNKKTTQPNNCPRHTEALADCAVATMLFADPAADDHHRPEDYAVAVGTLAKSVADQLGDAAWPLSFCVLVPDAKFQTAPSVEILKAVAAFGDTLWGSTFKSFEIRRVDLPRAPKGIWNPKMKISGYLHTTQLKLALWGLTQFRRIVYLDADSLQMPAAVGEFGSIAELFAMSLGPEPRYAIASAYDAQKGWEKAGEQEWRRRNPFAKHGLKLTRNRTELNAPGVTHVQMRRKTYKQLLTGCMVITPSAEIHYKLLTGFENYKGVALYSDSDFITDAAVRLIGSAYAIDPLFCAYRGNKGGNPPYAIQYGGSNPWDSRAAKYPDVQPWIAAATAMADSLPAAVLCDLRGEFIESRSTCAHGRE